MSCFQPTCFYDLWTIFLEKMISVYRTMRAAVQLLIIIDFYYILRKEFVLFLLFQSAAKYRKYKVLLVDVVFRKLSSKLTMTPVIKSIKWWMMLLFLMMLLLMNDDEDEDDDDYNIVSSRWSIVVECGIVPNLVQISWMKIELFSECLYVS